MGRNVSALIGKSVPHIPKKGKDPGTFCIPCIIGNNKFENVMLDLGASINVMPLSIFKSLSLGPMQPTGVVIQLANRSVAHRMGFIEDFLVRIDELIFPANSYVLDMEEGFSHGSAPIILGRPFLKTARTKIDVYAGTLSMEFGDSIVHFNILDAMRHPSEDHSIFRAEILDDVVNEYASYFHSLHHKKHCFLSDLYTSLACTKSESDYVSEFDFESDFVSDVLGVVPLDIISLECEYTNHVLGSTHESDLQVEVHAVERLVPSDVQPTPTPELKPLPENLMYAYLEDDERFLVIISTSLDANQEERLLHVLRKHKKAIGWTLEDIPGISPSTCMHMILLEDGAKPVRQPQRRLHSVILEVVKKEVTKLLQAGIIYPILDSQWVMASLLA
uniref:Transposon Ty3-I Gag-Pol polyprotein n=1 Tax=Cajanus cajan TaxID=3821 RepID=A0A151UHA3_CAJCA